MKNINRYCFSTVHVGYRGGDNVIISPGKGSNQLYSVTCCSVWCPCFRLGAILSISVLCATPQSSFCTGFANYASPQDSVRDYIINLLQIFVCCGLDTRYFLIALSQLLALEILYLFYKTISSINYKSQPQWLVQRVVGKIG